MNFFFFFFFNDTATTEIYTLSLHDALPISRKDHGQAGHRRKALAPGRPHHDQVQGGRQEEGIGLPCVDRKSTRLNSSHGYISYAVFCLKKKQTTNLTDNTAAHPATPSTTEI